MYAIKPSITFAHSYAYGNWNENSGTYSARAMFLGFTGLVPTDLDTLPFDQSDVLEMYAQAQVGIALDMEKISSSENIAFTASHLRTYLAPKQHYLDQDLSKWSYAPTVMLDEKAWSDWKSGTLDSIRDEHNAATSVGYQRISALKSSSMLHTEFRFNYIMQGMRFIWNKYRQRDSHLTDVQYEKDSGGTNYSYYSHGNNNRYAYTKPLVIEFDESVEIDSLEYYRGDFSDNRYSSNSVDLEVWDPALNEGSGGWSGLQSIALVENGVDSPAQYVELETIVTGKAFRLTFGDTGGYDFHFGYVRLLSSTPPETLPVDLDITWGLIIPYSYDAFRFDSFLYRETYVSNDTRESWFTDQDFKENAEAHKLAMPMLLVDVDDPNKDAAVTLTKARNVKPGQVPELLNFILDFTNA